MRTAALSGFTPVVNEVWTTIEDRVSPDSPFRVTCTGCGPDSESGQAMPIHSTTALSSILISLATLSIFSSVMLSGCGVVGALILRL